MGWVREKRTSHLERQRGEQNVDWVTATLGLWGWAGKCHAAEGYRDRTWYHLHHEKGTCSAKSGLPGARREFPGFKQSGKIPRRRMAGLSLTQGLILRAP